MTPLRFFPAADATGNWKASNRALGFLIGRHRAQLAPAVAIAQRIHGRLTSIFPVMDTLCRVTCPWCPEPCCIVNKVWLDFQDLLFMHLTGEPIPSAQLTEDTDEACRFLSPGGCSLPRIIRPWACTLFTCPTQRAVLRQKGPSVTENLDAMIAAVRIDRMDMEEVFTTVVVRSRRDARTR